MILLVKEQPKHYLELDIKKTKQFIADNYHLFSSPFCLAMDEFGVNLGETSRYAYSQKGCRAIISRTGQKGFNHTVFLCVVNTNKDAVVSFRIIKNESKKVKDEKTKKVKVKKGTSAVDFYNFLKDIKLPTNDQYFLFLDNSRIHYTTKNLIELGLSIEELSFQKNIVLTYLPPYTPTINPAELCNCFIKGYLKGKLFQNEDELKQTINEAIEKLQFKDLTKYFLHCRDYFKTKSVD